MPRRFLQSYCKLFYQVVVYIGKESEKYFKVKHSFISIEL